MCLFVKLETTGLKASESEILAISIMNESGKVMFDSLIKPTAATRWDSAEKINRISPAMVENSPSLEAVKPFIQKIFSESKDWVSYNPEFDEKFLMKNGIKTPKRKLSLMKEFAPIYGQWDNWNNDYTYPPLKECVSRYHISKLKLFNGTPCRADLIRQCWNAVEKEKRDKPSFFYSFSVGATCFG